jgi:hypothetical protein
MVESKVLQVFKKGSNVGKTLASTCALRGPQKLVVKLTSNPFEAGTARHTPPMQKMPSRRLP